MGRPWAWPVPTTVIMTMRSGAPADPHPGRTEPPHPGPVPLGPLCREGCEPSGRPSPALAGSATMETRRCCSERTGPSLHVWVASSPPSLCSPLQDPDCGGQHRGTAQRLSRGPHLPEWREHPARLPAGVDGGGNPSSWPTGPDRTARPGDQAAQPSPSPPRSPPPQRTWRAPSADTENRHSP